MPTPAVPPENLAASVAEYARLRPVMTRLHGSAARLASKDKDAVRTCARRLQMLSRRNGRQVLVFEHELEAEIFQDYLLYMYRPRGFSFVRQLCNRRRNPPDSDEQRLLVALAEARFSLFVIRELYPEGGFTALDLIRGEELFLFDQSIPTQEVRGVLTGLRVFPMLGAWIHTGANLDLGRVPEDRGLAPLGRVFGEREEREMNEYVIRSWRERMLAG